MKNVMFLCSFLLVLDAGVVLSHPSAFVESSKNAAIQSFANEEVSIDDHGYVRNSGDIIGQVDASYYVRDTYGNVIGQMDDMGYVYDANGEALGQIDEIGYIHDRNDRVLALHDVSGYLVHTDGRLISRDRVDRELVVFLFFFR